MKKLKVVKDLFAILLCYLDAAVLLDQCSYRKKLYQSPGGGYLILDTSKGDLKRGGLSGGGIYSQN